VSALAKTAYFFRTATGSIVRSPFVHLIAIASVTLALVGFGFARLARWQLDALLHTLAQDVEITIYLQPDADEKKVNELVAALEQRTLGKVTRVSAAQALQRLAQDLGPERGLLDDIGDTILPNSLELKLPFGARSSVDLAQLVAQTRALDFVNAVDFSADSVSRVEMISGVLTWAAALAFLLVFLIAVVVVSATLQLGIFARRDEIDIQKLVGATDVFVRIPFLLEGLLQGALAALLASAIIIVTSLWFEHRQAEVLAFFRAGQPSAINWFRLLAELCVLGLSLGLLGSFIAVRRFLRV
jgi:cell division transport system permease protein